MNDNTHWSAAGDILSEKRVATVPEVVAKLIKQGFRVAVEVGTGDLAQISDDAYRAAGAEVVADPAKLWAISDIVFKVRAPNPEEVALLREGATLVSFIWPAQSGADFCSAIPSVMPR